MVYDKRYLIFLSSGLFILFSVVHAEEKTSNQPDIIQSRNVIITTVPVAKEAINIPQGYTHCFTVQAGWYQTFWIPEHRVCQYDNIPGHVAWVEGYWLCNRYKLRGGECTNWEWKNSHWSSTLVVY